MTGVLFIAYYFPPMRTSGAVRAQGFVRYLPDYGYCPWVVTASTYGVDTTPHVVRAREALEGYRFLFNQRQRHLPPSQRTQARTAVWGIGRLAAWCKRHLLVPDAQIGWLPHALWLGMASIRRQRLRLICSTGPPFSSHLLGLGLKALTGLPWVADFRDTWTYDPLDEGLDASPARLGIERRMEAAVVRRADRIVAVTDVACNDFRSRFPSAAQKVRLIPNGFDSGGGRSYGALTDAPDGPFCLVHTGSFSYSHFRRSPQALFCALKTWLLKDVHLPDRLRVFLVGPLSPQETEMAAPLTQRGLVQLVGTLPQAEAIAWQRRAHALLLVDHPRPDAVRASNVPAKCYEYLSAGKPICALVPEGATRTLIQQLGAGLCASPDDPAGIREMLQQFLDGHRLGTSWRVSPKALAPFERRALTGQLARCFGEAMAEPRVKIQDVPGISPRSQPSACDSRL